MSEKIAFCICPPKKRRCNPPGNCVDNLYNQMRGYQPKYNSTSLLCEKEKPQCQPSQPLFLPPRAVCNPPQPKPTFNHPCVVNNPTFEKLLREHSLLLILLITLLEI